MPLTPQQLRAADFVSRVPLTAAQRKIRVPLTKWIDPRKTADRFLVTTLDYVLEGMIYEPPIVSGQRYAVQRQRYLQHLNVILPAIGNASRAWALAGLEAQRNKVGILQNVVAADAPNLARICKEAREKAQKETLPETTPEEMKGITGEKKGEGATTLTRLERAKYRNAVRQSGNKYLLQLMAHPKGVDVIDAFAESAEEGKAVAGELLQECVDAITYTSTQLRTEASLIWSFPPAVLAGVQTLGAPNVKALTDFALAWASIEKRRADGILDVAGNAILALQLVGGPIGAAIGEVLDTALAVVEGALTFVAEVDQQQAAVASTFASPAEKLATGGSPYRALAGAAAVIVASAAPAVISRLKSRGRRAVTEAADAPQPVPKSEQVPSDPGMTSSRGKPSEPVGAAERNAARPESGAPTAASAEAPSGAGAKTSAPAAKAADAPATPAARAAGPESKSLPIDDGPVSAQQRANTPAQKVNSELGDVSSGSTVPKAQRGTRAASVADADSVPPRTLRQGFRDQIEEKLNYWRREREAANRELRTLTEERAAITQRMKAASQKKDTNELRILQGRRAEIDETISGIPRSNEWPEINRLERELRGTEQDYFDSLSSAAGSRTEYKAVLQGVDEVFGMPGPLNVEHIFPRSRMFQIPGFEKLSYEDQIALFTFRPGLIAMSAEANRIRGARRYRDLQGVLRTRYPERVAQMATIEDELEAVITHMVGNGPYRREQFARVARGESPLLPNGRPMTVLPPATPAAAATKPAVAEAAPKPKKWSLTKPVKPGAAQMPPEYAPMEPIVPIEGLYDSTPGPGARERSRPVRVK